MVQTPQSGPYKLSILVSCTSWKWRHMSLARQRMKTRYSEKNVRLKPQAKAEYSHGSCKGTLDVVDGQRA